jgi:hypothetical protein
MRGAEGQGVREHCGVATWRAPIDSLAGWPAARETIAASLVLVRVGMNGEGKGKHGAGLEIFLKG